ncbi:histidine kinase N-terminal 7TM domain-containing diguanylate cyclase [Leadbettera azotonutricia]|uniref:diguanylate cyclase n=1 Tax=Leadbettera azotonutricia (strain ATCC BAA-888 / DSM 13862 / ZAS-9) TaxID=545695 RepID=F5YCF4_LEAAZ|nr:diguanylate cyclase [Leadbettera azotonutricia]AEF83148.1 putative diguanylate cyclase [Leadbettera azotonutricia ZAS-9]
MVNVILVAIVCVALAMSFFIGIYVLFRRQSGDKNEFLLLQTAIIIFLLGHLLELTSSNAGEAFTAVKVLYLGACFVPVFAFFFIAGFCEVKLPPFLVRLPLLLLAGFFTLVMWTTSIHHLIYRDYWFDADSIHYLRYNAGPVFVVITIFTTFCFLLAVCLIIFQLGKRKNKYRTHLVIILICVAIPMVAELVYFITNVTGINTQHIYFTPHSVALMNFCCCLGIMRFNIFEIIPNATITAMDHIYEGFILLDRDNNYLSSNAPAAEIFPDIAKLSKGESIFSLPQWPEELKSIEMGSTDFSLIGEGTRYFRASVSPVLSNTRDLRAKIILIRNTSDAVEFMKELENAAYTDALTGLYNRKHFFELASMTMERSRRLSESVYAVMIDLDFFKNVNDARGHEAGDLVLKIFAGIIRQTCRSYDLVGRYGGEEFALFLTGTDSAGARQLLERIRNNISESAIPYDGSDIKVTCSIGFAPCIESDTPESAIKKADEALYRAKNSGRNKVVMSGKS